jgi:hypothetical protein
VQDGKGKKELKKGDKADKDSKEAPLPAGVKGRGWRESVGPRPVKDLSGEQPVEEEEDTKRRECTAPNCWRRTGCSRSEDAQKVEP